MGNQFLSCAAAPQDLAKCLGYQPQDPWDMITTETLDVVEVKSKGIPQLSRANLVCESLSVVFSLYKTAKPSDQDWLCRPVLINVDITIYS